MTTKRLRGDLPAGYSLAPAYSVLMIDKHTVVGGAGVVSDHRAGVTNIGTVAATGYAGVYLPDGGRVTNFGTIRGAGVGVDTIGPVINGSNIDTHAVIAGANRGVFLSGIPGAAGSLANFGTIKSQNIGVFVASAGENATNGSLADSQAIIVGSNFGVDDYDLAAFTLTNFGTISGGLDSVVLGAPSDRMIVEAGSTCLGAVRGGGFRPGPGATLELAAATETVTGLGATGTVSGAASLTFGHFGGYQFDTGGAWTFVGDNVLASSQSLTLETGATITAAAGAALDLFGSSTLDGILDGAGLIALTKATVDGLTIDSGTRVQAPGAITQSGNVTIGSSSAGEATVEISRSGVWNITGGVIYRGASAGNELVNYGLIESNATAAAIDVVVVDDGVIEATTGRLEIMTGLTGTGSLMVEGGAILQLAGAVGDHLQIELHGTGAVLALNEPKKVAATIAGFAAGDTIELIGIKASGANIDGRDHLVVVSGTTTLGYLQLTGDYVGDTFRVSSNGHGGTDITLATAAGASPGVQPFISAMAGMIQSPGGTEQATPAIEAGRTTLTLPKSYSG